MMLSRVIGRRRINAGERPSFVAAWGLVVADFVLVMAVVLPLAAVVITWAEGDRISPAMAIVSLVFVFFVPTQVLLILSGIWAAKSRWLDDLGESR